MEIITAIPDDFNVNTFMGRVESRIGVPISALYEESDRLRIVFERDIDEKDAIDAINSLNDPTVFEQLVEKARRVWRGEDTFTQAQAQKILAGLVLLENRRR